MLYNGPYFWYSSIFFISAVVIERVAFASVAPLEKIDLLITDSGIEPELVELFQEREIKVVIAGREDEDERATK